MSDYGHLGQLEAMGRKAHLEGMRYSVFFAQYESTIDYLESDVSNLPESERQIRAQVETWKHFWPNETFLAGISVEGLIAPITEYKVQDNVTRSLEKSPPPSGPPLSHDASINVEKIPIIPRPRQPRSSLATATTSDGLAALGATSSQVNVAQSLRTKKHPSSQNVITLAPPQPSSTESQLPQRSMARLPSPVKQPIEQLHTITPSNSKLPPVKATSQFYDLDDGADEDILNESCEVTSAKKAPLLGTPHINNGNHDARAQMLCGNCYMKGHLLKTCVAPVDKFGFISGCPLCNTKTHLYEHCFKPGNYKPISRSFLLVNRFNCPPIRWAQDFRNVDGFWTKPERPWTCEFSLKQAGKFMISYDERGRSECGTRDPAWYNPETIPSQAYPEPSESYSGYQWIRSHRSLDQKSNILGHKFDVVLNSSKVISKRMRTIREKIFHLAICLEEIVLLEMWQARGQQLTLPEMEMITRKGARETEFEEHINAYYESLPSREPYINTNDANVTKQPPELGPSHDHFSKNKELENTAWTDEEQVLKVKIRNRSLKVREIERLGRKQARGENLNSLEIDFMANNRDMEAQWHEDQRVYHSRFNASPKAHLRAVKRSSPSNMMIRDSSYLPLRSMHCGSSPESFQHFESTPNQPPFSNNTPTFDNNNNIPDGFTEVRYRRYENLVATSHCRTNSASYVQNDIPQNSMPLGNDANSKPSTRGAPSSGPIKAKPLSSNSDVSLSKPRQLHAIPQWDIAKSKDQKAIENKILKLSRKLEQIKSWEAKGEMVSNQQLQRIARKGDIEAELAALTSISCQPPVSLEPNIGPTTGPNLENHPSVSILARGVQQPMNKSVPVTGESSTSTNVKSSTPPSSSTELPTPLASHSEDVPSKDPVLATSYARIVAQILPKPNSPNKCRKSGNISSEEQPWPSLSPSTKESSSKPIVRDVAVSTFPTSNQMQLSSVASNESGLSLSYAEKASSLEKINQIATTSKCLKPKDSQDTVDKRQDVFPALNIMQPSVTSFELGPYPSYAKKAASLEKINQNATASKSSESRELQSTFIESKDTSRGSINLHPSHVGSKNWRSSFSPQPSCSSAIKIDQDAATLSTAEPRYKRPRLLSQHQLGQLLLSFSKDSDLEQLDPQQEGWEHVSSWRKGSQCTSNEKSQPSLRSPNVTGSQSTVPRAADTNSSSPRHAIITSSFTLPEASNLATMTPDPPSTGSSGPQPMGLFSHSQTVKDKVSRMPAASRRRSIVAVLDSNQEESYNQEPPVSREYDSDSTLADLEVPHNTSKVSSPPKSNLEVAVLNNVIRHQSTSGPRNLQQNQPRMTKRSRNRRVSSTASQSSLGSRTDSLKSVTQVPISEEPSIPQQTQSNPNSLTPIPENAETHDPTRSPQVSSQIQSIPMSPASAPGTDIIHANTFELPHPDNFLLSDDDFDNKSAFSADLSPLTPPDKFELGSFLDTSDFTEIMNWGTSSDRAEGYSSSDESSVQFYLSNEDNRGDGSTYVKPFCFKCSKMGHEAMPCVDDRQIEDQEGREDLIKTYETPYTYYTHESQEHTVERALDNAGTHQTRKDQEANVAEPKRYEDEIICFSCNKVGHHTLDCPEGPWAPDINANANPGKDSKFQDENKNPEQGNSGKSKVCTGGREVHDAIEAASEQTVKTSCPTTASPTSNLLPSADVYIPTRTLGRGLEQRSDFEHGVRDMLMRGAAPNWVQPERSPIQYPNAYANPGMFPTQYHAQQFPIQYSPQYQSSVSHAIRQYSPQTPPQRSPRYSLQYLPSNSHDIRQQSSQRPLPVTLSRNPAAINRSWSLDPFTERTQQESKRQERKPSPASSLLVAPSTSPVVINRSGNTDPFTERAEQWSENRDRRSSLTGPVVINGSGEWNTNQASEKTKQRSESG
ncbi:hypothetical protein SBOR_4506 [Sclerotinia borealis F-4128]|uniref:CCHC-type domain-containing protein n=1 Tax=Sclerotinia borealis (strain F-4128) TaxID=1432307 RepID=W9CKB6_SCLBF|nr:hypothetical protein SBOR_4506 [Sclerotinia borealis F-4128]